MLLLSHLLLLMTQMFDILVGYPTSLILDAGHVESFVVEQTDDTLLGE